MIFGDRRDLERRDSSVTETVEASLDSGLGAREVLGGGDDGVVGEGVAGAGVDVRRGRDGVGEEVDPPLPPHSPLDPPSPLTPPPH